MYLMLIFTYQYSHNTNTNIHTVSYAIYTIISQTILIINNIIYHLSPNNLSPMWWISKPQMGEAKVGHPGPTKAWVLSCTAPRRAASEWQKRGGPIGGEMGTGRARTQGGKCSRCWGHQDPGPYRKVRCPGPAPRSTPFQSPRLARPGLLTDTEHPSAPAQISRAGPPAEPRG